MPAKPCQPNCACGKHIRTPAHNVRIGISVSLTAQAKNDDDRKHCADCGRIIADGETLCPECKVWYVE